MKGVGGAQRERERKGGKKEGRKEERKGGRELVGGISYLISEALVVKEQEESFSGF